MVVSRSYDMGLGKFLQVVVRHKDVKDRLVRIMLDNIAKERRGELIDRSLMKNTGNYLTSTLLILNALTSTLWLQL